MIPLIGGVLIWSFAIHHSASLAGVRHRLCAFLFGMGMASPIGTALLLAPFGAHAGAASALLGFVQMSGAALGATFATKLTDSSPRAALGILIAALRLLAIAVFALRREPGIARPVDSTH